MFIVGNPITISWIVGRTSKTIPSSTFDITLHDPSGAVIYTDDAPLTYLAPTATETGLITYVCPASNPGVWRILLSTGTASTYLLLDTVRLSVRNNTANFETRLIALPTPDPRTGAKGPIVQGPLFGPHLAISAMATNGVDKIMITGNENPLGLGIWITDMQFQNEVFKPFAPTLPPPGLNSWTGCGYGDGTWFITSLFGVTYWSDDDGDNWTQSIFPDAALRTSSDGNWYSENLDIHYCAYGATHYSIDNCRNFLAQQNGGDALPVGDSIYSHIENPFGGNNLLVVGGGQEHMHHTTAGGQSQDNASWTSQDTGFSPSVYNIQHAVGVNPTTGWLYMAGHNTPIYMLRSIDGFTWQDIRPAGDLLGVITNAVSFMQFLPGLGANGEFWCQTQTGPDSWYKSLDGVTYDFQGLGDYGDQPFEGVSRMQSLDDNSAITLPNDGYAVVALGPNIGGLQFYISHYARAEI